MRGGWDKNYGGTAWRPNPKVTSLANPLSIANYKARAFNEIPYPRPMLDSTALVFFDSTYNNVKLYPYINRAELYDVNELREQINPGFVEPPLNLDAA